MRLTRHSSDSTSFEAPVNSSYDFGLWWVDRVTSWLAAVAAASTKLHSCSCEDKFVQERGVAMLWEFARFNFRPTLSLGCYIHNDTYLTLSPDTNHNAKPTDPNRNSKFNPDCTNPTNYTNYNTRYCCECGTLNSMFSRFSTFIQGKVR